MEKSKVFSGKTVEEAIASGLTEFSLTRDEVDVEIIDEGKKKLFGSVPAQVRLTEKKKLTDGERAVVFLEGLFELTGETVVVSLQEEGEKIIVNLTSATEKGLIGRRGEYIDAVQVLAGAVANTGRKEYKRVVVDCGNYREEREETLKHVAEKLAAKAVRLGKRVRLEPMNPYERRIIHSALVDNPDVTTKSEGKEPARFVVIIPKNLKAYKPRDSRGGDKYQGNRDGKYDNRYGNNRYNNNNRDSRNRYDRNEKGERNGYDRNRGRSEDYNRKQYDRYEKKPYQNRETPQESTPQSSGTSLGRSSSGGYKKGFSGFFGTYLGNSRDDESTPDGGSGEEKE